MLNCKILEIFPTSTLSVLKKTADNLCPVISSTGCVVGVAQDLSPKGVKAMADMMPDTRLRHSTPILA
jgi:hypothetical protein